MMFPTEEVPPPGPTQWMRQAAGVTALTSLLTTRPYPSGSGSCLSMRAAWRWRARLPALRLVRITTTTTQQQQQQHNNNSNNNTTTATAIQQKQHNNNTTTTTATTTQQQHNNNNTTTTKATATTQQQQQQQQYSKSNTTTTITAAGLLGSISKSHPLSQFHTES